MEDRSTRDWRSRDSRDKRMDQWLETGRQLVDGVSGRRPGQRRGSLDLDSVGRWVGEKVEWLLEEDDDWREPWQEQDAPPQTSSRTGKRPLDAISRRSPSRMSSGQPAQSSALESPHPSDAESDQAWPDDDSFRVDHWKRGDRSASSRRALPRSSRRRD
jgi:hypothetical protein